MLTKDFFLGQNERPVSHQNKVADLYKKVACPVSAATHVRSFVKLTVPVELRRFDGTAISNFGFG